MRPETPTSKASARPALLARRASGPARRAWGTARRASAGFTLIELLIVVSIVSILALIAAPRILGSREKALTAACLSNYHRLDGDITTQMSTFESQGRADAATAAIDAVVAQAEREAVPNPRRKSELGFVDGGTGPVIPGAGTSCQVFFYDATPAGLGAAPTVVVTQFEFEARSFRIALN